MTKFFILAALAVCCCWFCFGADVDHDSIARKLSSADLHWNNWEHFEGGKTVAWDLSEVDSSKFTPAEIEYLIKWARNEEKHSTPGWQREGTRVGFVILVKFKDKKTLEYVDKQFSRGWYWAFEAGESLENAGELSLLPLAAKYLWVQKASEPRPPMEGADYTGAPSYQAVHAIERLLRVSWQSPKQIRKAAKDIQSDQYVNGTGVIQVYRLWWAANEQRCLKGNFDNLSSPLDYLSDQDKKRIMR